MFCASRAFRLGESGRLSPDFAVARATVGVLVLHEVDVAMRLNTEVVLCVPKGESRRLAHVRNRNSQISPQEKNCTLLNVGVGEAPISPARQHTYKLSRIDFIAAPSAKLQVSASEAASAPQQKCTKNGRIARRQREQRSAKFPRRDFNYSPRQHSAPRATSPRRTYLLWACVAQVVLVSFVPSWLESRTLSQSGFHKDFHDQCSGGPRQSDQV